MLQMTLPMSRASGLRSATCAGREKKRRKKAAYLVLFLSSCCFFFSLPILPGFCRRRDDRALLYSSVLRTLFCPCALCIYQWPCLYRRPGFGRVAWYGSGSLCTRVVRTALLLACIPTTCGRRVATVPYIDLLRPLVLRKRKESKQAVQVEPVIWSRRCRLSVTSTPALRKIWPVGTVDVVVRRGNQRSCSAGNRGVCCFS